MTFLSDLVKCGQEKSAPGICPGRSFYFVRGKPQDYLAVFTMYRAVTSLSLF